MILGSCSRQWEVEAIRDGRVVGLERREFEAHLTRCRVCREHADEVEAYAQKLKQLPSSLPDAFTLRRQRQDLVRAFNASLVAPPTPRLRVSVLISVGVVAAVALFGFWQQRAFVPARWVDVSAASTGRWSESRSGQVDRVALREGHFELSIHRPSASSRVVLALPDGEIEDLGTVLEVWIENGHTNRISVQSGEVVLHLRGVAATNLRAGQHWARAAEPDAVGSDSKQSAEPVAQIAKGLLPLESHASPSMPSTPSLATRQGASAGARPSTGAVEVATEIATGDEDAAYLRVLTLLEADRPDEAKIAAQSYLAKYRHGFRRLEVMDIERRLIRADKPSQ